MCLLFRRRRFERNCRKSKWQPHPTFFSGWWLSHDWICWVMRCLLSQVILLEKIRETLGPQAKTNKECMHSGCRMIEYVEWWDAFYLKSYYWKRSEKLWDHKQKQIQSACSQPPWKKSGVFVELLASFPWLHGDLPHTAHTVAERVVLCRGAWFWNKILQDAMAENLDKQWIRITGTRDAPALAPPALRRKTKKKKNLISTPWLCHQKN